MKLRFILLFFILFFFVHNVFSEYYWDANFQVMPDGTLNMNSHTNYLSLKKFSTHNYTRKQGNYWLLNFTSPVNLSAYTYSFSFPRNVVVNYIKTNSHVMFKTSGDSFEVYGFGHTQRFYITIQYSFQKSNSNKVLFFILTIIIIVAFLTILLLWSVKKKRKIIVQKRKDLTPRQKLIFDYIAKRKSVFQKEIQNKLNLPKSSTSRNLKTLERMGLVKINRFGLSNKVLLNDEKEKKQ